MKKNGFKAVSILLAVCLCVSIFSACGSSEAQSTSVKSTSAPTPTADTPQPVMSASAPIEPIIEEEPEVAGLSNEQKASMAMLNYLAYVVQEINASRRSRLTLETAFDALTNDVEPKGVDGTTREAFNHILNTIKQYRLNSNMLERLEQLNDQENALSILSVVSDPSEIINAVMDKDYAALADLAFSTLEEVSAFTYVSDEELTLLQREWDLEDSEEQALLDSRINLFNYMVQIAQGLPEGITLSEEDISEYITQTTKMGGGAKLDWLEKNQEKYQYFGYYWLELAASYYENRDYSGCLSAIATYQARDTGIFRNDKRLAQSMKYAIVSAKETMSASKYEEAAAEYIETILSNISKKDWELRYYAALALIELYNESGKEGYLEKAFEELKENIQHLVPEQQARNKAYIDNVIENQDGNDLVNTYNKYIKNSRKTELPPISEPLQRNCELLFSLAKKLAISDGEKQSIDNLLHNKNKAVFLSYQLEQKFSFSKRSTVPALSESNLSFSGTLADQRITIPILFTPEGTTIRVDINNGGQRYTLTDWAVYEVDRKKSNDINDFVAVFTCKAEKAISYREGDTVTIQITPPGTVTDNEVLTIGLVVDRANVLGIHFKQTSP
ncbi:MAG: hypothetical protein IJQ36_05800 [Oscillospiraceae bacterium]|nr:hypothetical protein [Oscillospiraceae bacterium]MBQ7143748.1 hypothetical protein [Oscillospiraceae bacterium]